MADNLQGILPFCHLDDDTFRLAIFELNQGPINFDTDHLESLYFNPLSTNYTTQTSFDIDPDQQFYCNHNSDYYVPDQFNDLCQIVDTDFSVLHLNVRSINQNLHSLTELLTTLNMTFSVIGISETWLKNNDDHSIHLDGYDFIHSYRSDKSGGGVGIFVNTNLNHKHRYDLDYFDHQIFESIFIEIERPKEHNIIIGTIYRPPGSDFLAFNSKLNEILDKISNEQKPCYLIGDYNIDLLKYEQHTYTNDFLDTMFSHFFLPLINHPTRITSHTASLIDNIFTNHFPNGDMTSGLIFSDISDHLPIFTLLRHSESLLS